MADNAPPSAETREPSEVEAPGGFRFGGATNFAISASAGDLGSVATLEVSGELDLGSSERFDVHVEHLLAGHPDHVVIDLRGLSFIDSSGLRHLVRLNELSAQNGFRLWVVCGAGDRVRRTLQVSGLEKAMPISEEPPHLRPV